MDRAQVVAAEGMPPSQIRERGVAPASMPRSLSSSATHAWTFKQRLRELFLGSSSETRAVLTATLQEPVLRDSNTMIQSWLTYPRSEAVNGAAVDSSLGRGPNFTRCSPS